MVRNIDITNQSPKETFEQAIKPDQILGQKLLADAEAKRQVEEAARQKSQALETARIAKEEADRQAALKAVPHVNSYSFGQCTWYVATRRNIPSDWGNANAWLSNALAAGWATGSSPQIGAIAWTGAGFYGHVAFVEQIGTGQVLISEMNYNGGVGIVNQRWTPISDWVYIY